MSVYEIISFLMDFMNKKVIFGFVSLVNLLRTKQKIKSIIAFFH